MVIVVGSIVKDDKDNSYILDSMLGSGSFGDVYKAHRENDSAVFAVKILRLSFENSESLLSFQNELQQTLLISSNHVIKYIYAHDGDTYPEYPPYIIMEFAESTLTSFIDNQKETGGQFENKLLINFFTQLAEGMHEINKILIHRDIKPDNILICNNKIKISDFGLSKLSGETTRTLTFKGYGSPKYVAPEAWGNDKNTIQMDIYSMGIVFYELATLRYPYNVSPSADFMKIRNAHMFDAPANPESINPRLPSYISSIIIRMMEKPTQKRFTTWENIIHALKVQTLPNDELSNIVTQAIKNRNENDIKSQQLLSQKKKQEEEKENHCLLINSQYISFVIDPIQQFIDRFNSRYPGTKQFKLDKDSGYSGNSRFVNIVTTPSDNKITITTQIISKEDFQRKVRNWYMDEKKYHYENYVPQCKGRDVLLWSQVCDKTGHGYNLLLLKNERSLYGDWYILKNRNSGLNRSRRIEPFGFTLDELPDEIINIDATHIYISELSSLKSTDTPDFLSEHV